jgi:hypothetical protein
LSVLVRLGMPEAITGTPASAAFEFSRCIPQEHRQECLSRKPQKKRSTVL